MKARSIFLALAVMIFAFASCTNEAPKEKEDIQLETRGAAAAEDATESFVNGTFKNENTFVNLKIDGTFEASFDGSPTIVGKWNFNDDQTILKLVEDKGTEGKGQSFSKELKVLELSNAVMRVEDQDGNVFDLNAE